MPISLNGSDTSDLEVTAHSGEKVPDILGYVRSIHIQSVYRCGSVCGSENRLITYDVDTVRPLSDARAVGGNLFCDDKRDSVRKFADYGLSRLFPAYERGLPMNARCYVRAQDLGKLAYSFL